jgi:hypothetical protein
LTIWGNETELHLWQIVSVYEEMLYLRVLRTWSFFCEDIALACTIHSATPVPMPYRLKIKSKAKRAIMQVSETTQTTLHIS